MAIFFIRENGNGSVSDCANAVSVSLVKSEYVCVVQGVCLRAIERRSIKYQYLYINNILRCNVMVVFKTRFQL